MAGHAPHSEVGSSSCNGNSDEIRDGEEQNMIELSEIIIRDVENNTWSKTCGKQRTIFRVPKERLPAAEKWTYQAMIISFGPYYHGNNTTEEMRQREQGKLACLGILVAHGGPSIQEMMQAVASMEAEARSCYEGDIGMDQNAFCKMLLLDAVQLRFVIAPPKRQQSEAGAHGRSEAGGQGSSSSRDETNGTGPFRDLVTTSNGGRDQNGCPATDIVSMVAHDLMMLENQIPFFVVKRIHELINSSSGATAEVKITTPLAQLAWGIIAGFLRGTSKVPRDFPKDPPTWNHLVHMCQIYMKPSCLYSEGRISKGDCKPFQRATEYYMAGVKFKQLGSDAQSSLLDVDFSGGVLRMAHPNIDEKTGYILRNVLAYEQKYYPMSIRAEGNYVTAYVVFMSQLLSGPEDVALLVRRRVLEQHLGGDDKVCALFQELAQGLIFDPAGEHYLNPVGVALQDYCKSRLPRWRAWIVRNRLSNPWLVAAWVFGALAVLGAIVQTVYAVLAYYNRHS